VIFVTNNKVIELKNIGKTYSLGNEKIYALNNINLTVNKGDFLAITGASGSGKSTLMNILGFLDIQDSGDYYFCGENCKNYSESKLSHIRGNRIGFVFQGFHLLPNLTAIQNVELPLIYNHTNKKERRMVCEEALHKVGLIDRAFHKPNQLSGGQKQRAAIARAIALSPSILLADEPTGNLDPNSSEDIIKHLIRLNNDGTTVIMITHDNELAKRAKSRIEIKNGQLYKSFNKPRVF